MKIVAVDDEKNALKVLSDAIMQAMPKDEVVPFLKPTDALEFLKHNTCEIVFLDISMPQIDGKELAGEIKKINAKTNIIFVTGYSEYMSDAIRLHASGYLTKPVTSEDISKEINNLLYPPEKDKIGIFAHTFGHFDLFVDGKPIYFAREKSREMLAYLIDRGGASVTRKELLGILFEDRAYDRNAQNYLSKIFAEMMNALKKYNADSIVIKRHNQYAVDRSKFDCDAYDFIAGDPKAINSFNGEYMVQYEWADMSMGQFYR